MSEPSQPPLPPLLKIGEVAKYLNACVRTVRRRVKSGEIPALRLGRSLRFKAADIVDAPFLIVPKNKGKTEARKLGAKTVAKSRRPSLPPMSAITAQSPKMASAGPTSKGKIPGKSPLRRQDLYTGGAA